MKFKARFIFFILIGLFLVSLITRNGSIILLMIPLITYLGIGFIFSPYGVNVKVKRKLDIERCTCGTPVQMSLNLSNLADSGICIMVEDTLPEGLTREPDHHSQWIFLEPGDDFVLQSSLIPMRGHYAWEKITLRVSDPFRLYEQTITLDASADLLVLPEPRKLRNFHFSPGKVLTAHGTNLARLPGGGTDFWGLREYIPGDPLRLIEWKKTARYQNELFTKTYEREGMADIGFFLDGRMPRNLPDHEGLFNAMIQAAADLSKYFLDRGDRISLFGFGESLMRVFPGYGKAQLQRTLSALAKFRKVKNISFLGFKSLPVGVYPQKAAIFVFTPWINQTELLIKRFSSRGYRLIVVIPYADKDGQFLNHQINQINSIERKLAVNAVSQLGVTVIEWDISQPFGNVLHFNRHQQMQDAI